MTAQKCRDCDGNSHAYSHLGPCSRCGSCCECYCGEISDVNPSCGHHILDRCSGCMVCRVCDGCYCWEG
jgi:hypothetical protein